MVQLFFKNNPRELAYLVGYGLLANINLLFVRTPLPEVNGTWVYLSLVGFIDWVTFGIPFLQSLLFLTFIFAFVFNLHVVFKKVDLFESGNYLIPFCALLLIGLFNYRIYYSAAFFASVFSLFALKHLLNSYRQRKIDPIFDAALLSGCAVLFYPPAAFLFPLLLINLFFVRPINASWRELVLSLVGFTVPFYFLGSYLYLTDQLGLFFGNSLLNIESINIFWTRVGDWLSQYLFVLVLVLVGGIGFYLSQQYFKSTLYLKKHFVLFVLFSSFSALALSFETPLSSAIALSLVSLPTILALCFASFRNVLIAEIIHLALFIVLLIFQYRIIV